MSLGFSLQVYGVEETHVMLRRGMEAARYMRPALRRVADDLMTRVIAVNFSSEGRRGGGSWAQLDEEYEKRKLAKGYPDKILQARRRLINSVTKPKSRNQELDIGDDYLDLSSRLEYAAAHQFGIPGKLPARPYLSFVAGDVERWAKICEEYLIERMSR